MINLTAKRKSLLRYVIDVVEKLRGDKQKGNHREKASSR